MRRLLRSLIQNATVTATQASWPVRLRVDPYLLRAAEMLPFEEVEVVNVSTGDRIRTWVEAGEEGTGEVAMHAGARTPVRQGDVISVLSFVSLHEGQTLAHKARVVTVDPQNHVVAVTEG